MGSKGNDEFPLKIDPLSKQRFGRHKFKSLTTTHQTKMSRTVRNNNDAMSRPFCKICFDAGKPESEYTSHRIRRTSDPNSDVTCPVLLATECRYCHQMGHTISRCILREQNNRARDAPVATTRPVALAVQAPVPVPVARPTNSRFAVLLDDEEETAPAPVSLTIAPAPVDVFPSLSKSATTPIAGNNARVSYTSAFKSSDAPKSWKLRTIPTVEVEEVIQEYDSDDDEVYEKTVTVSMPALAPPVKPKVALSYLDIFNKSLSNKVAPLKKLNASAEKTRPETTIYEVEDELDEATEEYLAKFEVKEEPDTVENNPVLNRSYHYDNPYYEYDW